MTVWRRRECGRCGAVVREGKTRHFCGDPYPAKVTTDIREVEYLPAEQHQQLADIVRALVAANDTHDGAVGEVQSVLGDDAAERLRTILGER